MRDVGSQWTELAYPRYERLPGSAAFRLRARRLKGEQRHRLVVILDCDSEAVRRQRLDTVDLLGIGG